MAKPPAARDKRRRENPRGSLADFVFDKLNLSIKSGAYQPEERLPTEHELAAEFQVSRPIVRDALQRLREQGLVYSRRGAGTFVRSTGLREPLGFGRLESIADLQNCYEFRIAMEPEVAAASALRRRDDELTAIEKTLDALRDAIAQRRNRGEADFAFHCAIARASDNPFFTRVMEALRPQLAVGMRFHDIPMQSAPDAAQQVLAEHHAIFDAICLRHADDARTRMRHHLVSSRDRLFAGNRPADSD